VGRVVSLLVKSRYLDKVDIHLEDRFYEAYSSFYLSLERSGLDTDKLKSYEAVYIQEAKNIRKVGEPVDYRLLVLGTVNSVLKDVMSFKERFTDEDNIRLRELDTGEKKLTRQVSEYRKRGEDPPAEILDEIRSNKSDQNKIRSRARERMLEDFRAEYNNVIKALGEGRFEREQAINMLQQLKSEYLSPRSKSVMKIQKTIDSLPDGSVLAGQIKAKSGRGRFTQT